MVFYEYLPADEDELYLKPGLVQNSEYNIHALAILK